MKFHLDFNSNSALKADIRHTVFVIGSCFAQESGNLLQKLSLPIFINPFGILYSPAAVSKAVRRIIHSTLYKEEDEYIKGPDKFPLNPGRWGYLPVEMQTILHEVNADCQISKTNTNLKDDHPCLLRHGIEISQNQSFVACISDAIFFGKDVADESGKKQPAKILSIKEMRERIIKAISIDTFIKYQNGNKISINLKILNAMASN